MATKKTRKGINPRMHIVLLISDRQTRSSRVKAPFRGLGVSPNKINKHIPETNDHFFKLVHDILSKISVV